MHSARTNLCGEDVARRPGDISAEFEQGLDQYSGLDSHVQTACDPGALQRLLRAVDLAEVHQARHLVLSHYQLFPPPVRQGDVG